MSTLSVVGSINIDLLNDCVGGRAKTCLRHSAQSSIGHIRVEQGGDSCEGMPRLAFGTPEFCLEVGSSNKAFLFSAPYSL